ncbi:aldolase/citrate lyase family protein [Tsuneonella sp. HG249]
MSAELQFLMIVDDSAIAKFASDCGVNTLFVDLEHRGKAERQPKAESWKSSQTPEDISRIREVAPEAELLVRLNPMYEGSASEVEDALQRGADCIMLPMFSSADEVARFQDLVGSRAKVVALFETAQSLNEITVILRRGAPDRAHFGLNDLHLDFGMRFMFEPLAEGLLDDACAQLRDANVPFGIGGVARVGEGILDPAVLLGEHVRLGSTWAILSRSFHRQSTTLEEMVASTDVAQELAALRAAYRVFSGQDADELEANRIHVRDRVRDVANLIARA